MYFHRDFNDLVDTKDDDGKTPLHLALENGMYSRVEILLKDFSAGVCMCVYVCVFMFYWTQIPIQGL